MALPRPELPEGCVVITFTANVEGWPVVTKVVMPYRVAQIMRAVTETMEGFPPSPKYAGLVDWFSKTLSENQFRQLDAQFPLAPTPEEMILKTQIQGLQLQVDALQAAQAWIVDPPVPA